MIPHIKFSIVLLLFFFSCKENKATPIETKVIEVKNNEHPNITYEYAFYRAFADCNSEIGYFTQEEAQKLYAEKEITIDIKQGTRENKKNVFSNDKLKCLEEHLNVEVNNEVLKFNPKDNFPFDNLILINNKYIIVSRDGYFFVFKRKNEQINKKINESSYQQKDFETLLNKNIVGLSIVNTKEKSVYKKYGIDFSTSCLCDSPTLHIDKKKNELIIFNYCDSSTNTSTFREIKQKHIYKISKITIENNIIITTENNLTITFSKIKNLPFYELSIKGAFPTDYTGNDLKKIYTTEPEKYVKEDCGDYEG